MPNAKTNLINPITKLPHKITVFKEEPLIKVQVRTQQGSESQS